MPIKSMPNMLEAVGTLLGLLVLTFATRLLWASELGSDFYTQFFFQRAYRVSRSASIRNLPNSVIQNGTTFYPPLPGILYALLPERRVVAFGISLNYLCDFLVAITIYFVLVSMGLQSIDAGLAAALWLCLPILHPVNARLIGLGARTIGGLLVFWFFLTIAGNPAISPLASFAGAVILALLTLTSSQFGFQALLVMSPFASLALGSPAPAMAVAGAVLVSFAIPGLGMRLRIVFKGLHVRWYLCSYKDFLGARNSIKVASRYLGGPRPLQIVPYLLTSATPTIILFGLSGMWIAAAILSPWRGHEAPTIGNGLPQDYWLMLAIGGLVGTLLTMRGPLAVFGEAERYTEIASPFMVLLLAILSFGSPNFREAMLLGIVVSLTGVLLHYLIHIKLARLFEVFTGAETLTDNSSLFAALEPFGARRIATSPITLASRLSINAPPEHQFQFPILFDADKRDLGWPVPPAVYPYLDLREASLATNRIDTVVIKKNELARLKGPNHPETLLGWRQIDADPYMVYLRSGQPLEASRS
jgi:hypothetical protein